jgi:lipoprotein-anchoring transpeptidase ErfK/SrfK
LTGAPFNATSKAKLTLISMAPRFFYLLILALAVLPVTSCSVVEDAGLLTSPSAMGNGSKSKKTEVKTDSTKFSSADKAKADREAKKTEESKAAAAAAKKVALKNKELEEAKRKLAAVEKTEATRKAKEDEEKARGVTEEKLAKEKESAARAKSREDAKLAKAEARKKAEEARAARELEELASGGGGGFFSRLAIGTPAKYKSEGHDVFVNQRVLGTLEPANAKIEISLSEQRARIYKQEGAEKVLVIETQVSTGKSGHSTSPGTFKISEKLPTKQSTLYGHWVNADGVTVPSSGSSDSRPAGGAQFVGAEMPYWMRINGGIGMHIGYVPDHPASHGCIRVPSTIQPLIFAKVGVGTEVTIIQ